MIRSIVSRWTGDQILFNCEVSLFLKATAVVVGAGGTLCLLLFLLK